MTVLKAAFIIIIATLIGGVGGATVGYCLGKFSPSYYETVFHRRSSHRPPLNPEEQPQEEQRRLLFRNQSHEFYPEEVGFGLGLTQGIGAGIAIGCFIVVCVTVANWWKDKPKLTVPEEEM